MIPFFNTPERLEQLKAVAQSWIGTPFVPNAAVKGAGVSCQKLVGSILIECGHLPAGFKLPDEPMGWANAHADSLIVKHMEANPTLFSPVPLPAYLTAQPGDVLGIRFGGCIHHCGIVVAAEGKFIHCVRNRAAGVQYSHLGEAVFMRMVKAVWRPVV